MAKIKTLTNIQIAICFYAAFICQIGSIFVILLNDLKLAYNYTQTQVSLLNSLEVIGSCIVLFGSIIVTYFGLRKLAILTLVLNALLYFNMALGFRTYGFMGDKYVLLGFYYFLTGVGNIFTLSWALTSTGMISEPGNGYVIAIVASGVPLGECVSIAFYQFVFLNTDIQKYFFVWDLRNIGRNKIEFTLSNFYFFVFFMHCSANLLGIIFDPKKPVDEDGSHPIEEYFDLLGHVKKSLIVETNTYAKKIRSQSLPCHTGEVFEFPISRRRFSHQLSHRDSYEEIIFIKEDLPVIREDDSPRSLSFHDSLNSVMDDNSSYGTVDNERDFQVDRRFKINYFDILKCTKFYLIAFYMISIWSVFLVNKSNQLTFLYSVGLDKYAMVFPYLFNVINFIYIVLIGYVADATLYKFSRSVYLIIAAISYLIFNLMAYYFLDKLWFHIVLCIVIPFGSAAVSALIPVIITEHFGIDSFCRVYGISNFLRIMSSAIFVYLFGVFYDMMADEYYVCSGSKCFHNSFIFESVLSAVAVILSSLILWYDTYC